MTREDALELAITALKQAETSMSARNTEMGIAEGGKFRKLDQAEVKKLIA